MKTLKKNFFNTFIGLKCFWSLKKKKEYFYVRSFYANKKAVDSVQRFQSNDISFCFKRKAPHQKKKLKFIPCLYWTANLHRSYLSSMLSFVPLKDWESNREVLCYTSLSNGVGTSALEINLGNSEFDLRSNTELWHKSEADFATIILFKDIFYGSHIFIPYFPNVMTHLFSWKMLSKIIQHLGTESLRFKESWNASNMNR